MMDKAINELKTCSIEQLMDDKFIADLIRGVGLHGDPRVIHVYPKSEHVYLKDNGMLQIPQQLADMLIYLSDKKIKKYLEVGTFNGMTTIFITAYLSRFNPDMQTLTIDNLRILDNPYSHLNIRQHVGTSNGYMGTQSDFCFIDGDHGLEWLKKDYENVGKSARICGFHDILESEEVVGKPVNTKIFWESIKKPSSIEFTAGGRMGIGIL